MYELKETPSLEGYPDDSGNTRYYPIWQIKIHGAEVASEYPYPDLTPEQVRRVVNEVEELIGDAIWEIIDNGINEVLGAS